MHNTEDMGRLPQQLLFIILLLILTATITYLEIDVNLFSSRGTSNLLMYIYATEDYIDPETSQSPSDTNEPFGGDSDEVQDEEASGGQTPSSQGENDEVPQFECDEGIILRGATPNCVAPPDPSPPQEEVCSDGVDNDGDGQVDEGCPSSLPTPPKDNSVHEKYTYLFILCQEIVMSRVLV
jgi:hypothetical protein